MTDLNVGDIAVEAHPNELQKLLIDNEALVSRITLHSYIEHQLGNFSLSAAV